MTKAVRIFSKDSRQNVASLRALAARLAPRAAEVKELGHGVFTYVLLEGLKGRAAMKGEPVTVLRLISYISEQLPVMTKKYNQEEQYPVMGSSQGMDFPLVMAK
jgi:uncharacterized caspase-like protein